MGFNETFHQEVIGGIVTVFYAICSKVFVFADFYRLIWSLLWLKECLSTIRNRKKHAWLSLMVIKLKMLNLNQPAANRLKVIFILLRL